MNQVLDRLVQHAQQALGSRGVVLWEQRGGELVERSRAGATLEAGDAAQRAWQTGALARVDRGEESSVAVPVVAPAGHTVAVLELSGRAPDLALAQALASACGVVLDAPATSAFLNQVPLPAWVRDEAGRFTFINPAFAQLVGRPVSAILGQRADGVFAAPQSATSVEADRRLLAERVTHHFEARVACGGADRRFWVSRFLVTQPNGDLGLAGVALELTASKTVEAAPRAADARVRDVFEVLHDAVFIEREGQVVFANQALATALGEPSVASLTGTPWRRWLADEAVGDHLRLRRRDGSVGSFERTAIQVDDDGRPATAMILRDLTAQRLREDQLKLTARLATVGTLAATVAHEINNPLAFMMTNLHLIAQELRGMATAPPAPKRLTELIALVDDASHGVERIRRLVRAMGALARDTERQPTRPVALAPVIENALQLTNTEVRLRARLELSVGRLPLVDADETQLSQVLVNLLVNAAQAIAPGNADAHLVRVVAFAGPGGQAIIEVRDDGEGIAPEHRERIFEPFFTTKPVSQFTGLGLSIARGIVESFKGQLTVDSQPGVGTAFRVSLPPSTAAQVETTPVVAPTAQAQQVPGATTKRGRVLIVDDEPLIGKVLARGLRELHDPVVVNSARDALAQLEQGGFDAVISDVMMPGMDGMSFFAEVERRFPAMAARTVFISGGTFTPGTRELLERLPNPCLEKPLDLKRLMELVEGLVERGPFEARRG